MTLPGKPRHIFVHQPGQAFDACRQTELPEALRQFHKRMHVRGGHQSRGCGRRLHGVASFRFQCPEPAARGKQRHPESRFQQNPGQSPPIWQAGARTRMMTASTASAARWRTASRNSGWASVRRPHLLSRMVAQPVPPDRVLARLLSDRDDPPPRPGRHRTGQSPEAGAIRLKLAQDRQHCHPQHPASAPASVERLSGSGPVPAGRGPAQTRIASPFFPTSCLSRRIPCQRAPMPEIGLERDKSDIRPGQSWPNRSIAINPAPKQPETTET